MNNIIRRFTITVFFISVFTMLSANDWTKNLTINGFISQGYIFSTENDYLVKDSQDGSSEYTEAGLTVQKQVNDKLRVGMQFLSRDFGDQDNNNTKIDWAFADYRFSDYLGFRLGKIKTAMGLYNEGRDIDFLRPMVFLPQSIYDEQYRSYVVAVQGLNAYGNIPVLFGDFDYKAFIGNMNFDSSEVPMLYVNELANGILDGLQVIIQNTGVQTIPVGKSDAIDMKSKTFFGGSLFYNTPFSGSRIGLSYFKFEGESQTSEVNVLNSISPQADENGNINIVVDQEETSLKFDSKIPYRFTGSLEILLGDFTLASEYSIQSNELYTDYSFDTYDAVSQTMITNSFGSLYERDDVLYYVMLSYLINDVFTISVLYDHAEISDLKQYVPGEQKLVDVLDTYESKRTYKNDFGLGFRYDIGFNLTFKTEAHIVDGTFRSSSEILEDVDESKLKKDWSYFLAKMSFNF